MRGQRIARRTARPGDDRLVGRRPAGHSLLRRRTPSTKAAQLVAGRGDAGRVARRRDRGDERPPVGTDTEFGDVSAAQSQGRRPRTAGEVRQSAEQVARGDAPGDRTPQARGLAAPAFAVDAQFRNAFSFARRPRTGEEDVRRAGVRGRGGDRETRRQGDRETGRQGDKETRRNRKAGVLRSRYARRHDPFQSSPRSPGLLVSRFPCLLVSLPPSTRLRGRGRLRPPPPPPPPGGALRRCSGSAGGGRGGGCCRCWRT